MRKQAEDKSPLLRAWGAWLQTALAALQPLGTAPTVSGWTGHPDAALDVMREQAEDKSPLLRAWGHGCRQPWGPEPPPPRTATPPQASFRLGPRSGHRVCLCPACTQGPAEARAHVHRAPCDREGPPGGLGRGLTLAWRRDGDAAWGVADDGAALHTGWVWRRLPKEAQQLILLAQGGEGADGQLHLREEPCSSHREPQVLSAHLPVTRPPCVCGRTSQRSLQNLTSHLPTQAPLWSPLLGQGLGLPWIGTSPTPTHPGHRDPGSQRRAGSITKAQCPEPRRGRRGALPCLSQQLLAWGSPHLAEPGSEDPHPSPTTHLPLGPPAHVLWLGAGDGHARLAPAPQPVAGLLGPWTLGLPGASAGAGGGLSTRTPSAQGGVLFS